MMPSEKAVDLIAISGLIVEVVVVILGFVEFEVVFEADVSVAISRGAVYE